MVCESVVPPNIVLFGGTVLPNNVTNLFQMGGINFVAVYN